MQNFSPKMRHAEISYLHRNARTPIDDRGYTWDTARRNIVRQQKYGPSDAVGEHRDGYHDIVANLLEEALAIQFHRSYHTGYFINLAHSSFMPSEPPFCMWVTLLKLAPTEGFGSIR